MRFALIVVLLLGLLQGATAHAADRRIALVIGNGDYVSAPRLDNPVRDARLIASTLKGLGFTLIGNGAMENLDRVALEQAIREFGRAIGPGTIAMFYYSGHGVQMRGGNYLVPVSANLSSITDVDFELVDVDIVVRQMDAAHSSLNLIVLDACRNNPFGGRGLRDGSAGLAEMRAPPATLISYATQPGGVAQDGDPGGDSPYTVALSRSLRAPGIDVFKAFNMVGVDVSRATNGKQTPWVAASPIDGDFFLAPVGEIPGATAGTRPMTAPDAAVPASAPAAIPADREALFWQSVQGTNRPEELQAYLRRFPDGTFSDLARSRLAALQASGAAPSSPIASVSTMPAPVAPPPNPANRPGPDQTVALISPPIVMPPVAPPSPTPVPTTKPPPLAAEPSSRPTPQRAEPPPRPRPVSLPPPTRSAPPAYSAPASAPVVGFSATAADVRGHRFQSNRAGSEGDAIATALRLCHSGGDAGSCRIISMAHAPGAR